jgi:hypothetical protein
MLTIHPQVKIYLHSAPIDMRKSFDGLYGIILSDFHRDVREGGLFLFLNRRRNQAKILYWDTDGMAIWSKRLERNCFQRPLRTSDGNHLIVDPTELQAILSGIDLATLKRRKRYVAPDLSRSANAPAA